MAADFRYRQLGYVVLNVTDVERSSTFATETFGLDMVGEAGDGARFFRAGPKHHDLILNPAKEAAFARSAWELETDADLDKAFAHFKSIGLEPAWLGDNECASLSLERAFRVVEPVAGTTHEYYSKITVISAPLTNTLTKFQGGKHYGLSLPDPKAMNDFMVEQMGFKVSDYLEGWRGSLLRCFPNPDHHSFGALSGPKTGFHHLAFRVCEIDDIGKMFNRAKRQDVKVHFGIGRHPTSGSIHFYVYDPDFFVWEYTMGMEQFPEIGAREPRRMSAAPENYDLWGAVPDQEFSGRSPPYLVAA